VYKKSRDEMTKSMFRWVKNTYTKYMKAAKENEFPITEYGFLGERCKNNPQISRKGNNNEYN